MVTKVWTLSAAFACCLGLQAVTAESGPAAPAATPEFVYCPPAKFANCTTAKCAPSGDGYSCQCALDDRYSATAYALTCLPATATTVQSRYHPIDSYQECGDPSTDSPKWAWCLGYSCSIDANGNGAVCNCTAPPNNVQLIPYVVTTKKFLPSACQASASGEVWSSATPDGVAEITAFLQQQPGHQSLKPPIVVTGPDQP
jgi:hypothetical protein